MGWWIIIITIQTCTHTCLHTSHPQSSLHTWTLVTHCQYPRVPLISAATSCVACSSRTGMMFLSSKARGGAQKEIGGGSGEECDRRMVCVCLVCVCVCVRGKEQAPKAWHGFKRHSMGSVLRPLCRYTHTSPPIHAHTHTHTLYAGKPSLISCYYAPLKQLSVQSQMRGWHRWGHISRGLETSPEDLDSQ